MKFGTSTLLASLALLSSAVPAFAKDTFIDLMGQSTVAAQTRDWKGGAALGDRLLALPDLTTPQRAAIFSHLCMHFTNMSAFDDAGAACRKSVALDPTSWTVYLNRGNFMLAMGDKFAARVDYHKARELNPSAPTLSGPGTPVTYVVLGIPESSAQVAEAGE